MPDPDEQPPPRPLDYATPRQPGTRERYLGLAFHFQLCAALCFGMAVATAGWMWKWRHTVHHWGFPFIFIVMAAGLSVTGLAIRRSVN